MVNIQKMREIKKSLEKDFFQKKGVTGVDIGYKYVDGKKTDELVIRVYVETKKDVSKKEMIPKEIDGVKTDVIERTFVLHPLSISIDELETHEDATKYSSLKGGMSIGPCRSVGGYVFVGTLGCMVRDRVTNKPMLLSNYHVMCIDNGWNIGDKIAQPGLVDTGSCPADVVGELQRASVGGEVDCAVASHTDRGFSCSILDIGDVKGKAVATNGMALRKRGRTTSLSYGTVDTVDLSVSVAYEGIGNVILTNQIGISPDTSRNEMFGDHGDSGSVVLDNNNNVVGLYFAGSEDGYGVANPIDTVLDTMNVDICIPQPTLKSLKSEKNEWKEIEKIKEHKIEKFETKELKNEKFEIKEKPEKAEKNEKFEIKEIEHKIPDIGPYPPIGPSDPVNPVNPGVPGFSNPTRNPMSSAIEERLIRLETAIAQLGHFIGSDLRPDLSEGALNQEDDLS